MRGEFLTGSFGLISLLLMFPDYCLVYVAGISAVIYTPTEVELTQFTPEQELSLLIPGHLS